MCCTSESGTGGRNVEAMAQRGSTTRAPQSPRQPAGRVARANSAQSTAPTKRIPRNVATPPVIPTTPYESLVQKAWRAMAHATGSVFRLFPNESVHPDDRRHSVPFTLFVLALGGIVIEWFNYGIAWATTLALYTVAGALGLLRAVGAGPTVHALAATGAAHAAP